MLALALRNLFRNRRRSLGTLLAVAIGSTAVLMFGGYRLEIKYNMLTHHVRTGGHLQVQHRDFYLYGSGNPTAYGIERYDRIIEAIRTDEVLAPLVEVVSPQLQFGGIAGNYAMGVSRTVLGIGLQATDAERMRQWNQYELKRILPPLALNGSGPESAVVGTGLARVLMLCEPLKLPDCPRPEEANTSAGPKVPADLAALSSLEGGNARRTAPSKTSASLELLSSGPRGTPNVATLEVVKAENQGIKELDDVFIAVPLQQAQRLVYGRSSPRATALQVQLRRTEDLPKARARIESILPQMSSGQPLVVLDFEQLNPFYVQAVRLFDTIFGFIFVLIGGIVLFTVSNTMNTAVVERTVEIGTLRAIGLRGSGIQRLFVTEGLLLGVTGALLGVTAALVISVVINHSGLTWLPPGNADEVALIVRVWGESSMILGATVGLVVVSVISAWWPAQRASTLDIVAALRHA